MGTGESLRPVQPTPKGVALVSPTKSLQVLWALGPLPSHGEQMRPGRPAASHPWYPGPGCGQDKAEGSASLAVNEETLGREKLLPAVCPQLQLAERLTPRPPAGVEAEPPRTTRSRAREEMQLTPSPRVPNGRGKSPARNVITSQSLGLCTAPSSTYREAIGQQGISAS